MAFIEPMHRNKPNITYLLTIVVLDIYIGTMHRLICPEGSGSLNKCNPNHPALIQFIYGVPRWMLRLKGWTCYGTIR